MMNFRCIKDSLINNILGPASSGKFQVVGFQRQAKSAEETLDFSRLVQVFYHASEFPKGAGRLTGPVQHDITYRVELTVSKAAGVNLLVINDENATQNELAPAIAGFQEASDLADKSIDKLFDLVYQILMCAQNYDMQLPVGTVANRWITNMQKEAPMPRGEYVILTGFLDLTLRTAEQIGGEALQGIATEFDVVIDQDGDDVEKAGVSGTLGG